MPAAQPLNIILLMTDQHRADHVGFLPGARLATPHLDRLAESVGFSNCQTVNPICTPARRTPSIAPGRSWCTCLSAPCGCCTPSCPS